MHARRAARPTAARRRTPHARGATFLEVVLGTVLLSLVAATFSGVTAAVVGGLKRQEKQLAAAEVANRLLLIYLDDEDNLPGSGLPIAYGDMEFRFSLDVLPVGVRESGASREAPAQNRPAVPLDRRLRLIAVTAWLAEDSGGAAQFTDLVPYAQVTRVHDTLVFNNPDAAGRVLSRPDEVEEYFSNLLNAQSGGIQNENAGSGSGQPSGRQGGQR